MVIVKIIGGLGNQMFTYAYAKALNLRGYEVKIDISGYDTYALDSCERGRRYMLDQYDIDLKISSEEENNKHYKKNLFFRFINKIKNTNKNILQEKSLRFDKSFLSVNDGFYINGYFQSEKYFLDIKDILYKQFSLKNNTNNLVKEYENEILKSKSSCSLHVRRGDFTNAQNINIHGVCTKQYYQNAMKLINNNDVCYFVFSDDISWVKQNLNIKNAIYVSDQNINACDDMYLMSKCEHNIIANSSFSWWGAWLNQNKNKLVIAPKVWFKDEKLQAQSCDIVCDSWMKI